MLACLTGGNEQPIAGPERDDFPVEADAQRPVQHIADMTGFAPVFRSDAGLELDQSNLPRALAENLLTHVRTDLLPPHG